MGAPRQFTDERDREDPRPGRRHPTRQGGLDGGNGGPPDAGARPQAGAPSPVSPKGGRSEGNGYRKVPYKFQMRSPCRFAQGNGADPGGYAAPRPNGEGPFAEHGPEEGRVSSGSSS